MHPSGHVDTFARDNLPPADQWPVIETGGLAALDYPARFNAADVLLGDALAAGHGNRPAIHWPGGRWSYAELAAAVDRIAHVIVQDMGVVPGNRILLHGGNSPMLAAAWLAIVKAGAIAVATMPQLRARELAKIVTKAEVDFCLFQNDLKAEIDGMIELTGRDVKSVAFNGDGAGDGSGDLAKRMAAHDAPFAAADTASDDVCIIAFTSGTTGQPKGTLHFHRDMLTICDTFSKLVLEPVADDIFIGSPPLAFAFGLGGLLLFPMRAFASTVLGIKPGPPALAEAIGVFGATVCFSAPTAFRAMLDPASAPYLKTLRKCVSAGETLPAPVYEQWRETTGISIIDGIGSTEMLHIFISAREVDMRAGATGIAVPGYRAQVVDEDGNPVFAGTVGKLAVRGPTGCRYLADDRQLSYVQNGWNLTGDAYLMDEDGYFVFQARTDDMIVSSGYNIAGPEVESALLEHPGVSECAVVGAPDPQRGHIVKAYVVLRDPDEAGPETAKALQDFTKSVIAPYKYPRAVEFVAELPRTPTGKVQRFRLREDAAGRGGPGRG